MEQLEKYFDTAFGAPGGVNKLRELILSLAMRGKLVNQDPNELPASELLKKTEIFRKHYLLKNNLKIDEKSFIINPADYPYDLPSGWKWVRLSELAYSQAGFSFKSNNFNTGGRGMPLIRIRDVGQPFTNTYYAGEYRDEFIVNKGDFLISMDGEFRVAQWEHGPALLNQRVSRLNFYNQEMSLPYIALALQNQLKKLQGTKAYTTVDHLSGQQISASLIPLPPLKEQHRINNKIDSLVIQCNRLEKLRAERDQKQGEILASVLSMIL